jgi:hypothetical protein
VETPIYPPPPWRLRGNVSISFWWLRTDKLRFPLPKGVRLVSSFNRTPAATVFAEYLPGGDLQYDELALVLPVRRPGLAVTVPHIWVDSLASAVGGRELWGVPKELATFDIHPGPTFAAEVEAVASLSFSPAGSSIASLFARRSRARVNVVQNLNGRSLSTPLRIRGAVEFGKATWHAPISSPLALCLSGRPFLSLRFRDAEIQFDE